MSDFLCIYTKKTNEEVTFKSREHIFPASLGGKKMLPKGFVADSVNNGFSALEGPFMNESILAIPRQFFGPGRRGSLSAANAHASKVGLITDENGDFALGYIQMGRPYIVDQIQYFNNDKINIKIKPTSVIDENTNLISDKFGDYNDSHKLIENQNIEEGSFLLAKKNKTWLLFVKDKNFEAEAKNKIREILSPSASYHSLITEENTEINIQQVYNIEANNFYRVCAKILFNYIADKTGQSFVLQDKFNPIREWILNGGENKFATFMGRELEESFNQFSFPEKSHKLFITKSKGKLIGIIFFYGNSINILVELANLTDDDDILQLDMLEGFVCDWQAREEYTWMEHISINMEEIIEGRIS